VKTVLVALGAAVLLAAVAVSAAAVTSLLPSPTRGVLTAAKEFRVLSSTATASASLTVNGVVQQTTCRTRGKTTFVSVAGGGRLVIRGVNVRGSGIPMALLSAVADLAGSHQLLVHELSDRLSHSSVIIDGTPTIDGRSALALRLDNDGPRVDLLVTQRGLRPLGLSYRGAGVLGSSTLVTQPLLHRTSFHPGC